MISYVFKLDDGRELRFDVDLDRVSSKTLSGSNDWTRLEYHKCPSCPLSQDQWKFCPIAVDVENIVEDFSKLVSCDTAEVIVKTREREYRKVCPIQVGLNSLMGLVMATSGCPILSSLNGMAHFHLPFSSIEETITRTVSFFLLKQLFLKREGKEGQFNLDALKAYYQSLEGVNQAFFERIQAAVQFDANLNAIINFCAVSWIVSNNLEQFLDKIKTIVLPSQGEATHA